MPINITPTSSIHQYPQEDLSAILNNKLPKTLFAKSFHKIRMKGHLQSDLQSSRQQQQQKKNFHFPGF